jgi:hypothetical protein
MDNSAISGNNEQLLASSATSIAASVDAFGLLPDSLLPISTLPLLSYPVSSPYFFNENEVVSQSSSLVAVLFSPPDTAPLFASPQASLDTVSFSGQNSSVPVLALQSDPVVDRTVGQALTLEVLGRLKNAAIERWSNLGLSPEEITKLRETTLAVDDLASNTLAETRGYSIVFDRDAAGMDWYVDLTPLDDSEFAQSLSQSVLTATANSAAVGKVDLFTIIEHELGPYLGL